MTRISARHFAATLALAASLAPAAASAQLLVAVEDGQVQGHVNDGSREFLGIPYAAPPVGPLRFQPPQDPTPWVTPLDASDYPVSCSQEATLTNGNIRVVNEDCLYLNVWTPDPMPDGDPLPVMFWIHGGSNTSGGTGDAVPFPGHEGYFYDGHKMAKDKGVIVVSVNYRLNVFGFTSMNEIAAEDPLYPFSGNQGLLDQRKGMQWVHDNIAAFGGDPANVTIFGESAGSFDVCAHVVSPGSQALFHKAISESGGCSVGVLSLEEAHAISDAIAVEVGCDDAPDRLACLRAVPTSDLLDAGEVAGLVAEGTNLAITVDGGVLDDYPINILDAAVEDPTLIPRKPYILGANSDEGTLFMIDVPEDMTEEEYSAELVSRFDTNAAAVELMYPASAFESPKDALTHVFGDAALVCSTYDVARRYSRIKANKARTFVYNFNRVPPLGIIDSLELGAFHGIEIGFVFNSIDDFGLADRTLSSSVQDFWTSLAKKGKPRAGNAKWAKFKEKTWKMKRLDYPMADIEDFRKAECDFWSGMYEQGYF